MSKTNSFLLLFSSILILFHSCQSEPPVMKIAFGSCAWQDHPLPIFNEVVKHDPDLFIFLGDNIYGDTKVMDTLRAKYHRLGAKESFQNLKQHVPFLTTWDDHDFGWNDAGRHYPFKEEVKEIFFDFFDEPVDSERRTREGIYGAYEYDLQGKKIQIIMLDTRTFRDQLLINQDSVNEDRRYFYHLDYTPHTTSDSTFLGEKQWAWLDQELQKPADVRIIGSSTQFGIEYNGYEAWVNYPHEQKRFLDLIKKNKASGVLFISGDVHYAEISKMNVPDLYPIYDITSSGLSSTWKFATPNVNRIEGPIMDNHFGLLTIDFQNKNPQIKSEIWDVSGNQRVEFTIPLSEITF
jgi:alkaline phosphatase D